MENNEEATHQTASQRPGWLTRSTRPLLAVGLTMMVCVLAWQGIVEAQTAVITNFPILIAYLFGERAALKRPGQDT